MVLLTIVPSTSACSKREENWSCERQDEIVDALRKDDVWSKVRGAGTDLGDYSESPCTGDEASITYGQRFRTEGQLSMADVQEWGQRLTQGTPWQLKTTSSRDEGAADAAHVCYSSSIGRDPTYLRLHSVPDAAPEPNLYVELTVATPNVEVCV
ncbi:hypothetical protein ACN263_12650 [Micromonospora sp. WMMD729]|uniref:hypothetical protein n=1 Tax=Micromonospora sp. WMMD729 TaxID=3404127 RepID=UPI003BF4AF13